MWACLSRRPSPALAFFPGSCPCARSYCVCRNVRGVRRLFHGTAKGAMPKINRNSFNRSYCGKNATVYGEGVYFAVGAAPWSIRDTYSPPDDQGFKYMYLARVAVGEFCEGDSSMRVPPAQPGTGDLLPYDATVDNVREPEMYVAYHDAQAYPEYLPEYLVTIRRA